MSERWLLSWQAMYNWQHKEEGMRKAPLLAAVLLAWVTVGIACGGGSSAPAGVTPAITPPTTPGGTAPEASLTPAAFPPGQEVRQFVGETIAFSYPADWYLWSNSYESERETVVLANILAEEASAELPPAAIRIEFTGQPAEPQEALPGAIVETFNIAGARFSLREGGEVPWLLTGGFKIGGIDFRYAARVLMNTPEPQMDVLRPILESWVIGSTNHHPPRTCISPGKCP